MLKIALLDDYAMVALKSADWSVLKGKAEITIFDRHLSEDEAAEPVPAPARSEARDDHRDVAAQPRPGGGDRPRRDRGAFQFYQPDLRQHCQRNAGTYVGADDCNRSPSGLR